MRKHFTLILTALLLMSVTTFAGGNDKKKQRETVAKIVNFDEATAAATASKIQVQGFVQSSLEGDGFQGTPTGLTGFYDYQLNGGACKYISVNPSDPQKIHVAYMLSTDSANSNTSRRTGYAYSSDGGATWNAVASVSGIREGFPSMTILNQGGGSHLGVVTSHNQPAGERLLARVFIDGDEGLLSFSSIAPPDPGVTLGGNIIWPYIEANAAGTKMWLVASFSGGPLTVHYTTFDATAGTFSDWSGALSTEEGDTLDSGGRYNVVVSPSGNKVALYHLGGPNENYISFSESTDGGTTFPAFKRLTKLTPGGPGIGVVTTATDSIAPWIGVDAVYRGENLNFVFSTGRFVGAGYEFRGQGIWFWSQATGFVNAVDTTKIQAIFGSGWEGGVRPGGAITQTNHFPIDYPTIGVTPDNNLHCVFTVARIDTASGGRNFYTVAYTRSTDGGATWSPVSLLETNAAMDFRYPSIEERGTDNSFIDVVYQQDPVPGSHAFTDAAPISRSQLLHRRIPTLSTKDNGATRATDFRLAQNYPNPFNPTTNISYVLPKAENVSLKIYDVLGREVATLVNEVKAAGAYTVPFNASNLASGVYFYKLQAGSFVQTKKMMLVK